MLYSANGAGFALPADENLFIARKVLEIGDRGGLLDRNADLLRGTNLPRAHPGRGTIHPFRRAVPDA